MKKIKFAVMIDNYSIELWQYKTLEKLINSGARLELFIKNNNEVMEIKKKSKYNTLKKFLSRNGLFYIYLRYLQKVPAVKKININNLINNTNELKVCTTNKGKFSQYFDDNDVEQIKSYDLDFIIRFGFNIIRGEILNSANYGVWSFHHDDETKFRGSPPSFWEVYYNEPTTGAILQRLTDTLDGGIILYKGEIKTSVSYAKNINNNLIQVISWPTIISKSIISGDTDKFFKKASKTDSKIFYAPTNFEFIKFLLFTVFRAFNNKFMRYLNKHKEDIWKIGYVNNFNFNDFLKNKTILDVKWINKFNKDDFRADPFAIVDNNNFDILYEGYDYKIKKGNLSVVSLDNNGKQILQKELLNKEYHLSFPFILKENNKYYCIPESHQSNMIELYEYDINSKELKKLKNIMENISAVDTVLFKHNEIWWMFYSLAGNKTDENLHISYSNSLFGDWIEHPLNPVKTTPRTSRMAGSIFSNNNKIYRPSQNCSLTYGGSVIINEITILTEYDYQEKEILEIEPKDILSTENFKGIHTFNIVEDKLIIDVKIN